MAVDALLQERAQLGKALGDRWRESDQRPCRPPHILEPCHPLGRDPPPRLQDQVAGHEVGQPPGGLVDAARRLQPGGLLLHGGAGEREPAQLVRLEEAGTEAVVQIVVGVGDVVGDGSQLGLQRCLLRQIDPPGELVRLDLGRQRAMQRPVMLHHAFEGLEGEVEAVEARVAVLEAGDDPEGLQVVVEAAMQGECGIECRLARMAEGAVAEIVRQRHGLRQILVGSQGPGQRAGDLRHLQRVGEPGAVMVALEADEDLGLVLEPAEGGRVQDAVAVALIVGPEGARRLGDDAAEAGLRMAGVRRKGHRWQRPVGGVGSRPFDSDRTLPT